jgi:hypothetical protein
LFFMARSTVQVPRAPLLSHHPSNLRWALVSQSSLEIALQ